MEAKGLKVNVRKTKVMIGGEGAVEVVGMSKWPCGVCRKGVGRNSLQCTRCLKWIHKKCSIVSGRLKADNVGFARRRCETGVRDTDIRSESLDIGDGVVLEKVGKFCYLGDTLNAMRTEGQTRQWWRG